MKDRSALARGWFRKADSDLADARRTTASEGPYDTACFHAQQAVELRYDAEFWPPQPMAADAVKLAERVRGYVLAHMPPDTRP